MRGTLMDAMQMHDKYQLDFFQVRTISYFNSFWPSDAL